jgi:MoxR-like ATPase
MSVAEADRRVSEQRARLDPLFAQLQRVIVGQRSLIHRLLVGLLTDGHLLLEGLPGLAKTLAVSSLARTLRLSFKRVQFTPDLLPADILGTQIYNPGSGEFTVKRGPIFAHVLLADEINRAPAKVQSALLEAMQERQVTIGDTTFPLPRPFLVLATQNPIEQEGTYPLPEAQVDRFMLKAVVEYPSREEELEILDRMGGLAPRDEVEAVLDPDALNALRACVDSIYVDAKIRHYLVDLVRATRSTAEDRLGGLIQHGASLRATLSLFRAAKAQAFLDGRSYVTPGDVKSIAVDVLRHRVLVSYEAEAQELRAEDVIRRILETVPVP